MAEQLPEQRSEMTQLFDERFNEATTKRELFAAIAMHALIADDVRQGPEKIAARSIEYADALLAGLRKEQGAK